MKSKFLLNPVFLIGLLVLALNDHLFKFAYGNWLTGKLSDVAGVLILPLFFTFLFGGSKRTVIAATVVLFSWWKSPWSQPAIDWYNAWTPISTGRVVDYTDLLAFAVLPLAWYTLKYIDQLALQPRFSPQLATYLVLPLASLAFVATSQDEDFAFPSSSIESCCGLGTISRQAGNGMVFLPAAFTPDGDGINDVLFPQTDGNIERIDSFLVFSIDTISEVFRLENSTDFSPAAGWDGMVGDTILAATYEVRVWVTAQDSTRGVVSGYVCALPCQQPSGEPRPVNLDECVFGNQFDPMLGFNRELDSGEELDCFD